MKDPYIVNLLVDFYEYIQEKPYKEIIDIVEEFMEHKDKELTEKAHKDYMDHIESKEEIKNGLNTKENELPAPRGHKEVCPHPANQVFLLNGWYRCTACNGKWKSKIK